MRGNGTKMTKDYKYIFLLLTFVFSGCLFTYATDEDPVNTFQITAVYNASSDSNSTVQQRHTDAIAEANDNILHPHDMNITSNSSVTSYGQTITNWDSLSQQQQIDIVNDIGVNWSEKNVPILYVDGFNNSDQNGLFMSVGNSNNPGKKLIIMKSNIPRDFFSSSDAETHGKYIIHEYGHNARLNHTGEINLMSDTSNSSDVTNSLSTDIAETDSTGNGYTLSQSSHRNQISQLQGWDGWP